jgi:uncharacterized membrane protein
MGEARQSRREPDDGRFGSAMPLLVLAMIAAISAGAATAILRHWSLLTVLLDIGVFEQAAWTFIQTGEPTTSINAPYVVHHWLGFHFSPLVLILSPLARVPWSAEALMAAQAVIAGSAAIPVFLTARELCRNERVALVLAIVALVHPLTANAMAWDFHENCIAVPLIAWALWAVVTGRYLLVWLCALLLVLTKEHYGLACAGLGFLWGWRQGGWLSRAAPLAGFGLVATAVVLFVIMPALSPTGSQAMLSGAEGHHSLYGWMGTGGVEAAGYFVEEILLQPVTVLYLAVVLLGFVRFSFVGLLFLAPAIADLAANLLSANPMLRSLHSYHSAAVVPCMMAAAAHGYQRASLDHRKLFKILVSLNLALAVVYSPWPFVGVLDRWGLRDNLTTSPPEALSMTREALPPEASVSAQGNLGAHLAKRREIYPFPAKLDSVDAVALHLDYPYRSFDIKVFGNPYDGPEMLAALEGLLDDPGWGIVFFRDDYLILRRDASHTGEVLDAVRARIGEMRSTYVREVTR